MSKKRTIYIRDKWVYHFGSGLPAKLWGASAWTFKHAITLQNKATPSDELHYYLLTKENLPCSTCTQSFILFQSKNPYFQDSKLPNQLSYLFHQTHNYVNEKNKQPMLSYEENQKFYSHLSIEVWLLALFDYLVALSIYQIDKSTTITYKKKEISKKDLSTFTYCNLLPLHKLILFLIQSSFLVTVSDSTGLISKFIELAKSKEFSLLDPQLYNIETLKTDSTLPYLAYPFITRLEKIRNHLLPNSQSAKLSNRAKILFTAKQ
jgi:hypothetical protein